MKMVLQKHIDVSTNYFFWQYRTLFLQVQPLD